MQDLLAGQIACSLTVVSNALSNVQAGPLRALAVTAPKWSLLPKLVPQACSLVAQRFHVRPFVRKNGLSQDREVRRTR